MYIVSLPSGVFRAIGLSNRQLAKMIIAEASTYAITGTICGSVLGIVCNKILFSKLITYKWGDAWSVLHLSYIMI